MPLNNFDPVSLGFASFILVINDAGDIEAHCHPQGGLLELTDGGLGCELCQTCLRRGALIFPSPEAVCQGAHSGLPSIGTSKSPIQSSKYKPGMEEEYRLGKQVGDGSCSWLLTAQECMRR